MTRCAGVGLAERCARGILVLAVLAATADCGDTTSASPSMKCADFLVLTSDQQQTVWVKAAQQAGRNEVATAGGLMNGISVCQDRQEMSVLDVAKAVSPY